MKLLEVKNLYVTIETIDGPLHVIRGLDFSLEQGESLGIVGESGCGKSITALAVMALLLPEAGVRGQILLNGENINALNDKQMRGIRGNKIGMIFQEPMTALNPVKTIGAHIAESLLLHKNMKKKQVKREVEHLLENVELPVQRFGLNLYPHQLSGGQRQRVLIAMAIACKPDLLIADEPTTALDVTVQEKILKLIKKLAAESGMSLIMISHNLGIIAQTTQKVMIMYAGKIMEQGETSRIFKHMGHPYTKGLFAAIPKPGLSGIKSKKRLCTIPGTVPDLKSIARGCIFAPRCIHADDICLNSEPGQSDINSGHRIWCFHPVKNGQ